MLHFACAGTTITTIRAKAVGSTEMWMIINLLTSLDWYMAMHLPAPLEDCIRSAFVITRSSSQASLDRFLPRPPGNAESFAAG